MKHWSKFSWKNYIAQQQPQWPNNKEYENIYNGTWVDADKLIANTNIKKYMRLYQRNYR